MFNKSDITRDEFQLFGKQAKRGYDWWWHSFTGYNKETGEPKQFFIEFFLINPYYGKEYPIYGQKLDNMKNEVKPSYMMVKVGAWGQDACQLHRFYSWKAVSIKKDAPFSITTDDCYLDEKRTYGFVYVSPDKAKNYPEMMSDSGSMSWDLNIDKKIAFNVGYGAGPLFRKLQMFEMFWHAEGMKCAFEGMVNYNGIEYAVRKDDCYGYADKNWGKDFTSPWVWLSSNNLKSLISGNKLENSVFDIGGGCPKIGPIALKRKLLSAFYYEGKCFEFNFSKFWTKTKTIFECEETATEIKWFVEQKTWTSKMVVNISCKKKDMLLINYEAPNGKKLHNRLWNGGNGKGVISLYRRGKLVDEIEAENVGCEYGEYCL